MRVFQKKRTPTRHAIEQILTNYLGGVATKVYWDESPNPRLFAVLAGTPTHPLKGITGAHSSVNVADLFGGERYIEIYVHDDPDETPAVDVMTRQGDELTGNIATGFAKILARFYDGRLDMG